MLSKLKLKKIKVEDHKDMPEMAGNHYAPYFSLNSKQVGEVADFEVGKKYRFVVEVEMKSKSEREDVVDGGFDILAYKELKPKKMEDMSDEEFEEEQGRLLSGGKL